MYTTLAIPSAKLLIKGLRNRIFYVSLSFTQEQNLTLKKNKEKIFRYNKVWGEIHLARKKLCTMWKRT